MYVEKEVTFLQADVAKYQLLMGSSKKAEILPPMMPAFAYQQLDLPWQYQAPVFLRKQKTTMPAELEIEKVYSASLQVIDVKGRGGQTFLKEVFRLKDKDGKLQFESISELVTGGITNG